MSGQQRARGRGDKSAHRRLEGDTPERISESCIREVYRNLGEDNQFRLDEEIDSEHNSKVVKLVAAEFTSPLAIIKAAYFFVTVPLPRLPERLLVRTSKSLLFFSPRVMIRDIMKSCSEGKQFEALASTTQTLPLSRRNGLLSNSCSGLKSQQWSLSSIAAEFER
eukprot:Em0019g432a